MNASVQTRKPRIAITMGDPCGVGPEILVKALGSVDIPAWCTPVVVGAPGALARAIELLDADLKIRLLGGIEELEDFGLPGTVQVISSGELSPSDMVYGQPSRATCETIVTSIQKAVGWAMRSRVDAICTCPINKANLHRFGFSFPGHTEFLQDLTRTRDVVMMLAGPKLRVALATIHHAISQVPGLLTGAMLQRTIAITGEALLRDFGLKSPRLAVAALNPHAGEDGRFGTEERDLITPVLGKFNAAPYGVSGPYPPDTIFYRAFQGEFDAVVAMYHDQGLIPIKLVHFQDAVNITLGLPIVRTSVDHGTAYDLAGTGKAHAGSLLEAVRLAVLMAENRRTHSPRLF